MGIGALTSSGIGERTNGFSRDFVDFISTRSDRLSKSDFTIMSDDYRNACYRLDSLLKKVKDSQEEDMHQELDEVINGIITLTIYMAFKAGFNDGVKMVVHSLGD
jgi:hypothetical protein